MQEFGLSVSGAHDAGDRPEAVLQDSLVVCTDTDQLATAAETWVSNSASLAVWHVTDPSNVAAAKAPVVRVRVRGFRAALAARISPPPRTIEPGINTILQDVSPTELRLSLDPDVQAAWAGTQVLTDLIGEARVAVDTYLDKSKTRRDAIYFCALKGFDAGKELAQADSSSETIAAALGLESAASDCRTKVQAVQEEDARLRPYERPRITLDGAVAETHAQRWTSITDDLIRATRAGLELILHK